MRVFIREAAYDDLDRIYAWIAKDRPRAADAVIDRILASADRLGRFPYMGHPGHVKGTYE
jgi:plasmid stabilization system protein ParE